MFKVTNNNDFDFSARFDGKNYKFPSKAARACPIDATLHIFGLNDPDKKSVVARHGWAKPTEPVDIGLKVLKNFAFEEIKPVYENPLAEDHGPAPVVSGTDEREATDGANFSSGQPTGTLSLKRSAK